MAKVVYKKYRILTQNNGYKEVNLPNSNFITDSIGLFRTYTFNQSTGLFQGHDSILTNMRDVPQYGYIISRDGTKVSYHYVNTYGPNNEVRLGAQIRIKGSEPLPPSQIKGSYIGEVVAEEGTYPTNGEQGGYWYEWDRYANTAPSLSGSDNDLGGKFEDFSVDYIVQDADGDSVKVEIKIDGVTKQTATATTLGVRKYYTVPIKSVDLGRHTIEIIATDSQGASATRKYTFQKVNSAPTISGRDENLGAKNSAFTYTYKVSDNENDSVRVIERLNGSIIRTLNNVTLDSDLSISVSDSKIRELDINAVNTIEIEASDGTATTYRRVTFVRNNMPPIISDRDKDLGNVTNTLTYSWSATDPEKDKMVATIYLDNKILKDRHTISEGANQSIRLDGLEMHKITRGKHTIKIVVEDDKGFSSSRSVTFTRVIERLIMKLAGKGIETDQLANRVVVSTAGIFLAKGAKVKYEVCNNSYDSSPKWEDATSMVESGRAYSFTNKSKTASKAGVDIRVTIEKGTSTGQSYITAIGGNFD